MHHGWKWREAADRRTGTEPAFPPEAKRQAEIAILRLDDPEAVLLDEKPRPAPVIEKPAEEKSAGSVDTTGERDHGEGEHGEPTQLVSPTSVRGPKTRRPEGASETMPGSRPVVSRSNTLRREGSRASAADMPDLQHVMSRTISLTGGSVHGGG